MVIDDRLKVWEDKDQPRVHVVPAFIPYYAPQAEVCVFPFQMISVSSSFSFGHIETEWELLYRVDGQCSSSPVCGEKCCL